MFEHEQAAHRHFAASCFNRCWELLDLPARTATQVEEMVRLAEVSLWHWSEYDGHAPQHLAVGYWQLSRACAVAGQHARALVNATTSVQLSREHDLEPFYLGYALEAQARALLALGEPAVDTLRQARQFANSVKDEESRALLEADLEQLERMLP